MRLRISFFVSWSIRRVELTSGNILEIIYLDVQRRGKSFAREMSSCCFEKKKKKKRTIVLNKEIDYVKEILFSQIARAKRFDLKNFRAATDKRKPTIPLVIIDLSDMLSEAPRLVFGQQIRGTRSICFSFFFFPLSACN